MNLRNEIIEGTAHLVPKHSFTIFSNRLMKKVPDNPRTFKGKIIHLMRDLNPFDAYVYPKGLIATVENLHLVDTQHYWNDDGTYKHILSYADESEKVQRYFVVTTNQPFGARCTLPFYNVKAYDVFYGSKESLEQNQTVNLEESELEMFSNAFNSLNVQ